MPAPSVAPDVRARIQSRLRDVEAEAGVSILYACESGSRAWGFASANSDYDVRFIYVHPPNWYLSIDAERRDDVIDADGTLDLHGWDLRKALGLFRACNPSLLEWLHSPIVYVEITPVMDRWRALESDYADARTLWHAYRGMAESVADQSLGGERVVRKTYLYVVRALLAVRWVERHDSDAPVPVPLDALVRAVLPEADVRQAVHGLIERKRAGDERGDGPPLPILHTFIQDERARLKDASPPPRRERPVEPLNAFFRDVVREHGANTRR